MHTTPQSGMFNREIDWELLGVYTACMSPYRILYSKHAHWQ